MHNIGNEYFVVTTQQNPKPMHDLRSMYEKTLEYTKKMFEDDVDECFNFRSLPNPPRMNDLEVIALAVCAESASIDSENWLFSKLKTDYADRFPELIDRTRFNRRRRFLKDYILEFTKRISMNIGADESVNLVDSMPCPIVKNSREKGYKICKENLTTAPRKGYSAVDRKYYIGYKLHLITNQYGVFQDMQITPANVHDIQFLKQIDPEQYMEGKVLVGDRGYISSKVQTDLFNDYKIELKVPYRRNQHKKSKLSAELGKKRRRIETQFAQLTDQFRLKHNYAKTFLGFSTRVISKLAGIAVLQAINIEKGRPINHIKHAWA